MFRQIKILALFIAIISSAPEETAKSAAGIFATTLAKACVSATGIDPSGSAVPTSLPTPTATASAATAEATTDISACKGYTELCPIINEQIVNFIVNFISDHSQDTSDNQTIELTGIMDSLMHLTSEAPVSLDDLCHIISVFNAYNLTNTFLQSRAPHITNISLRFKPFSLSCLDLSSHHAKQLYLRNMIQAEIYYKLLSQLTEQQIDQTLYNILINNDIPPHTADITCTEYRAIFDPFPMIKHFQYNVLYLYCLKTYYDDIIEILYSLDSYSMPIYNDDADDMKRFAIQFLSSDTGFSINMHNKVKVIACIARTFYKLIQQCNKCNSNFIDNEETLKNALKSKIYPQEHDSARASRVEMLIQRALPFVRHAIA